MIKRIDISKVSDDEVDTVIKSLAKGETIEIIDRDTRIEKVKDYLRKEYAEAMKTDGENSFLFYHNLCVFVNSNLR